MVGKATLTEVVGSESDRTASVFVALRDENMQAAGTRILMSKPTHYTVAYSINPWMKTEVAVNTERALKQWHHLKKTLEECGAKIELIEQKPDLPDMCFTGNAGFVKDRKVFLSWMRYEERQEEQRHYMDWFKRAGFEILGVQNKKFFEGCGDCLYSGDKLFAAFGFRTDPTVYTQLGNLFKFRVLLLCELVNSKFFHLDSCFCPITPELAIWYPPAFTSDTRIKMENEIELLPVSEKEALSFACNSVVVGKNVVMASGCPEIQNTLEKRGFAVHVCDMTEFKKAGGACKCLTIVLDSI